MEHLLNICNAAVFILILYGTAIHRQRMRHVKVMLTAFALDIALLLVVEFGRGSSAVGRAFEEVDGGAPGAMLITHLIFAISGLLLWFVQIYQGKKILDGQRFRLKRHNIYARVFLVCRLGNVVTAFFL